MSTMTIGPDFSQQFSFGEDGVVNVRDVIPTSQIFLQDILTAHNFVQYTGNTQMKALVAKADNF